MLKIELVVVGSKQDVSENDLSYRVIATANYACEIVVDLISKFGVKVEKFFDYVETFIKISGKILYNPFNCYFFPPNIFLFETIVKQNCITLLASLG